MKRMVPGSDPTPTKPAGDPLAALPEITVALAVGSGSTYPRHNLWAAIANVPTLLPVFVKTVSITNALPLPHSQWLCPFAIGVHHAGQRRSLAAFHLQLVCP